MGEFQFHTLQLVTLIEHLCTKMILLRILPSHFCWVCNKATITQKRQQLPFNIFHAELEYFVVFFPWEVRSWESPDKKLHLLGNFFCFLRFKKWIQRSDSIQIWFRLAWCIQTDIYIFIEIRIMKLLEAMNECSLISSQFPFKILTHNFMRKQLALIFLV